MKRIELCYINEIEKFEQFLSFSIEKSDCFSLSLRTKNYVPDIDIMQFKIQEVELDKKEESYYKYYIFSLNADTIKFLKSKNGVFDFDNVFDGGLQDLKFYKDKSCWFLSVTHEEFCCILVDEDELDRVQMIGEYSGFCYTSKNQYDNLDKLEKP